MTERQYAELIALCRNSKTELSGLIEATRQGGEVYVTGYSMDDSRIIKGNTSKSIDYNPKEYVSDTVFRMGDVKGGVFIRFHTHPGFSSSELSKADIVMLKQADRIAQKVSSIGRNGSVLAMECVVNREDVCFYTYDASLGTAKRACIFVDGIEKTPMHEKGFLQTLKDGFAAGRQRAGKR